MYYEQVGRVLSALSQAPIFVDWIFFGLHFFEWPLGIKPLHCHIACLVSSSYNTSNNFLLAHKLCGPHVMMLSRTKNIKNISNKCRF